MNSDKLYLFELLRDALVALSLSPGEQVRVTVPGCVSCDLLMDFSHACGCITESCTSELTAEQAEILTAICSAIEDLAEDDCVCFDSTVLSRPQWCVIRTQALTALPLFGWQHHSLTPYRETEPGVWRRICAFFTGR